MCDNKLDEMDSTLKINEILYLFIKISLKRATEGTSIADDKSLMAQVHV